MSKQGKTVTKKRGRPKTEPSSVVRLPETILSNVDKWASAQPEPRPTRSEAIRRLLEKALEESDQSDPGAFISIRD
jgi:hypothetical protein